MLHVPPPTPTWLPVADAAPLLGVSPRRVRQLAANRQVNADRVGGALCVKRDDVFARRNDPPLPQRPLSDRSLRLLKDQLALDMADAPSSSWHSASRDERRRARERARRLQHAPDPARLMRAWAANQPSPVRMWASEDDLDELRQHASGFSHPSARLASSGQLELRVHQLPEAVQEHRDAHHDVPVLIHLDPHCDMVRRVDVMFDLARHAAPREDEAAVRLLAS